MIGGGGGGPPALETWCVGQGSGQESGSLERVLLLTPGGHFAPLRGLLLLAGVLSYQTSPVAGHALPSHVMPSTNLHIHLAKIY